MNVVRNILICLFVSAQIHCAQLNPVDGYDCGQIDGDSYFESDSELDDDGDADSDGSFTAETSIEDVTIYAHSRTTLFLFSPHQNEVVSTVSLTTADGQTAPNMVDLAVNRAGDVYTSGFNSLFRVDPETGVVTEIGPFRTNDGQLLGEDLGVSLYALTFVPGRLFPESPAAEVLIGAANAGTCYSIDTTTAVTHTIGHYPEGWRSSGDLVSVEALGTTFATLREQGSRDTAPDYLAEVTFEEGGTITLTEPRPIRNNERFFVQIFGLGYWGRQLFGFSNEGELISINRATALAELATESTGADEFWGAGVTTQVPVLY